MYYFLNDYSDGCHPHVLKALEKTNLEPTPGYGLDPYCEQAAARIRARFACPEAAVHFFVGGTQTNLAAITAFLRPWEAVIAAATAHISVHETGAVEARGHKVYAVPTVGGKLTPAAIAKAVRDHQLDCDEHMVLPRLVYLSQATELGTVYTKAELAAIYATCRERQLLLYIDGARLGAALTAAGSDLTCEDMPQLCDAFYIGGTKNGLLFGEALVIVNPALMPYFRNVMKQCGGLLAKGRLLGVQFCAYLADDLWLSTARHANEMAARLSAGLTEAGFPLWVASATNQVFAVLPIEAAKRLSHEFAFELSDYYDETHEVYRFVTAWSTEPRAVDALTAALRQLHAD